RAARPARRGGSDAPPPRPGPRGVPRRRGGRRSGRTRRSRRVRRRAPPPTRSRQHLHVRRAGRSDRAEQRGVVGGGRTARLDRRPLTGLFRLPQRGEQRLDVAAGRLGGGGGGGGSGRRRRRATDPGQFGGVLPVGPGQRLESGGELGVGRDGRLVLGGQLQRASDQLGQWIGRGGRVGLAVEEPATGERRGRHPERGGDRAAQEVTAANSPP